MLTTKCEHCGVEIPYEPSGENNLPPLPWCSVECITQHQLVEKALLLAAGEYRGEDDGCDSDMRRERDKS